MGCLAETDRASAGIWGQDNRLSPRASAAEGSLSALARISVAAGGPAFTAHDLRRSCGLWADAQLPADVRRQLHRAVNEGRSGRAIAGLTLLLAVCGWIGGGEEGARLAVIGGLRPAGAPRALSDSMRRRRDIRRLHFAEAPQLFAVVDAIRLRAGLTRMPEVYVLPAERAMNAFALGTPDDAVITLTDGLLRGMTMDEIAAILAHEMAHICSNDASTMALAGSLHRMIRCVSLSGLAAMSARGGPALSGPVAWLLQSAPAIGELLCLALSRIRELSADAFAMELINDPRTLASALEKLERHHRGTAATTSIAIESDLMAYLRSHPTTDQRVSFVHSLA